MRVHKSAYLEGVWRVYEKKNDCAVILYRACPFGCSNSGLAGKEPPDVKVEVEGTLYETVLGSYCWGGGGQFSCVDMVGPMELLKGKDPIEVKPGEEMTFVMDFDPQPDALHLALITEEYEEEMSLEGNAFEAPFEKGIYHYSYRAWWTDDEKDVSGNAYYHIVIEVQ